jgi:hypothetical protein
LFIWFICVKVNEIINMVEKAEGRRQKAKGRRQRENSLKLQP